MHKKCKIFEMQIVPYTVCVFLVKLGQFKLHIEWGFTLNNLCDGDESFFFSCMCLCCVQSELIFYAYIIRNDLYFLSNKIFGFGLL